MLFKLLLMFVICGQFAKSGNSSEVLYKELKLKIKFSEWLKPYFKEGPRDDVGIFIGNPTVVSMDEEISVEDPIIIAVVAGYKINKLFTILVLE